MLNSDIVNDWHPACLNSVRFGLRSKRRRQRDMPQSVNQVSPRHVQDKVNSIIIILVVSTVSASPLGMSKQSRWISNYVRESEMLSNEIIRTGFNLKSQYQDYY